jgi:hypothetical protein
MSLLADRGGLYSSMLHWVTGWRAAANVVRHGTTTSSYNGCRAVLKSCENVSYVPLYSARKRTSGRLSYDSCYASARSKLHLLSHIYSQTQTLPNIPSNDLLILLPLLPPHARRIHIRRTLVIRLRQHAHDAYEDLLYALYGRPALGGLLVL